MKLDRNKYWIVFAVIIFVALALRLPKLTQRPMHTDEAVHAIKFGTLLEKGEYHYDSNEYHGPTLNYFTLIPARLSSAKRLVDISETTLRIVPVIFNLLLIILLLFICDRSNVDALVFTATFTAVSPAMIFYSRYYIQEILFVSFTFGIIVFGYRYILDRRFHWAVLTGIFTGLLHATKETCIIIYAAILLSIVLTLLLSRKKFKRIIDDFNLLEFKHLIAFIFVAIFVSILFYSSFFTNPAGILESVKTYTTYFSRASQNNVHIHPWYYYLQILIYFKLDHGPVWSEIFIIVLAIIGAITLFLKQSIIKRHIHFYRFIAIYTIILTVVFSAIPYKTPWNMLSFLYGIIFLAGLGAYILIKIKTSQKMKFVISSFIIVGTFYTCFQAYRANYKFIDDPANPYVYGHTSASIFQLIASVDNIARQAPEGYDTYIEVICPGDDYWPLPWYLRKFTKIGWWNKVNFELPAAPIIIAFPSVEPELMYKLYELPPPGQKNLYLPITISYTELRPQIEIRGYIVKELWDLCQN